MKGSNMFIPVVPARGGAEVALGIHYKTFHIYRTCSRQRVAQLPSRNLTCVRPPCTARPREDSLHTSQFRLHSLHFKCHTSSHLKLHFSNFFHTANFYTEKLLHTEAKSFCTQNLLHREVFTQKLVHREASSFCAQQAFTQRSFHTQKLLHKETLTRKRFYTQRTLIQKCFYTEKLLHRAAFTQKILHKEAFTQRSFYTQQTLTQSSFYRQKLLHREAFTQRSFYTKELLHRKAFTHSKL